VSDIYIKTCRLCNSDLLTKLDDVCNISKCSSCGYIFDNPRPSFDEINEYYSQKRKYDGWLENLKPRENLWKKRLKQMQRWKKPGNVLDIGTGIGQFLDIAREEFTEISGTEISESALQIAKEHYNLDIFHGSIESIDFSERKFDNITIFHVLEHVDDPCSVIKKCHVLLKENGILFIAVPNDIQSIKARVKEIVRKIGIQSTLSRGVYGLPRITLDGSADEIHLSHFTCDVLGSMLEREGFRILELSIDPYYVGQGVQNFIQGMYYDLHRIIFRITGMNFYNTIWVVADKRPEKYYL
jgi:SAM-dependent methyltransferase